MYYLKIINFLTGIWIIVSKDIGNNSFLWLTNIGFLFCKVKSEFFSIVIINDFDKARFLLLLTFLSKS
jgi:hypothetical protein